MQNWHRGYGEQEQRDCVCVCTKALDSWHRRRSLADSLTNHSLACASFVHRLVVTLCAATWRSDDCLLIVITYCLMDWMWEDFNLIKCFFSFYYYYYYFITNCYLWWFLPRIFASCVRKIQELRVVYWNLCLFCMYWSWFQLERGILRLQ